MVGASSWRYGMAAVAAVWEGVSIRPGAIHLNRPGFVEGWCRKGGTSLSYLARFACGLRRSCGTILHMVLNLPNDPLDLALLPCRR